MMWRKAMMQNSSQIIYNPDGKAFYMKYADGPGTKN
jgi:hypothetical protein